MPKTAILYLTHFVSAPLIERFRALQSECQARDDNVVLLYDESQAPFPSTEMDCVYPFSLSSVKAMGFPMTALGGKPPGIVPGHTDYPLIQFYLSHSNYDYYWLVEYDVRFTGRWGHFFETCSESQADLLATHVQRYRDNESWCWWDSLGYKDQPVEKDTMVRAFCPIYRLSKSACQILVDEYRKGWAGHFEVKLATVLHMNGCKLEDIGGQGEFVAPGHEDRFYIGESSPPNPSTTFQWRPLIAQPGPVSDKLWHPVKSRFPFRDRL